MFEGFGTTGELSTGEILASDSLASDEVTRAALSLEGTEGFEYLVILYPFQPAA
jgi:hypothetical protein